MLKKIKQYLKCHFLNVHNWDCELPDGVEVTKEQHQNGVRTRHVHATMHCTHCNKMYNIIES